MNRIFSITAGIVISNKTIEFTVPKNWIPIILVNAGKNDMLQSQRNMTKLLGLLLLILTASCCGGQNLGYDPEKAQIAVGYSSCVDIQSNFLSQISNWTYSGCTKFQEKENVESINLIAQPDGYLLALSLYDKEYNMNVLSFRATVCGQNGSNVKIDANISLEDYTEWDLEGAKVHSGFYNSYLKLQTAVRQNAMELYKKNPNAKFLVTGLSLGAALAAFAMFDLANFFQQQGKKVDWVFYTFGQPRIGNQNFIEAINEKITIYRVINQDDPVAHMPSRRGLATNLVDVYFHPGIQVYLPTNEPNTAHICAGDSSYCSLNKNKFILASGCNHIGYPQVALNETNIFSVEQNCPYDYTISPVDQQLQRKKVLGFFTSACQFLCKPNLNKKLPSCFAPLQPTEMRQCLNTPVGEDQLIQKILFFSQKQISLQKDSNATTQAFICFQVCPFIQLVHTDSSAQVENKQL